jgi:hypothetical protein
VPEKNLPESTATSAGRVAVKREGLSLRSDGGEGPLGNEPSKEELQRRNERRPPKSHEYGNTLDKLPDPWYLYG